MRHLCSTLALAALVMCAAAPAAHAAAPAPRDSVAVLDAPAPLPAVSVQHTLVPTMLSVDSLVLTTVATVGGAELVAVGAPDAERALRIALHLDRGDAASTDVMLLVNRERSMRQLSELRRYDVRQIVSATLFRISRESAPDLVRYVVHVSATTTASPWPNTSGGQ